MSETTPTGGLPLDPKNGGGRYPGFDVMSQAEHWDATTRAAVQVRLGMLADVRFFTPAEQAAATALFDQLLYQRTEPRVPVVNMVDSRLAEREGDGWQYESMPPDRQAWRDTLAALDEDAQDRYGAPFAKCDWDDQHDILEGIRSRSGDDPWHDMPGQQVWSLWTRYACVAFYSHPWAWNEIGFAGPAYPRGYKNLGVNKLEPFEVPDAYPGKGA